MFRLRPWRSRRLLPHALVALGLLLLAGVLLAVFLTRPEHRPTEAAQPAPTSQEPPPQPTTSPPSPPPTPAPAGLAITDLRAVSLSPLSATLAWQTSKRAAGRLAYGLPENGPTLWSDVSGPGLEHEATLSGLAFGTSYRVWVTAVTAGGHREEATLDLTTPGAPASPAASVRLGAVLIDGHPFFPIMVWGQCSNESPSSLALGINLFAENPCGGLPLQLEHLAGHALSAGVAGEPGGSGPGLVGYFYPDEADGRGMTARTLPDPPSGDPGGLRFLTLTNHFYSGAAPLPQGRAMYPGLVARADVVGFDLYPLQVWCRPERLADVYAAQQELVRLARGKPTFQWIEAAGMSCGDGPPTAVTPETLRAEAWLAIAGGAHGLGFYPAAWTGDVGGAIAGVARDVAALGPALLAPAVPASVEPAAGSVRVGARSYNGALYVIAVNASFSPTQATIRVPGLAGRGLTVLDEGREVAATGDAFSDAFAPLAAHVYVAAPASS